MFFKSNTFESCHGVPVKFHETYPCEVPRDITVKVNETCPCDGPGGTIIRNNCPEDITYHPKKYSKGGVSIQTF